MDSIWTQTAVFPSFPALEGDLRADAAIVGGGLTGILTAWLLRQAGADVVVLEADRVGGGQTAGTTAKLTAQHGLKYSQLLETLGNEAASQYARANLTAVDHLRQLIRQQDIDCDWRDCTSFLYASDAPCTANTTPAGPSAWTSFSPGTRSCLSPVRLWGCAVRPAFIP